MACSAKNKENVQSEIKSQTTPAQNQAVDMVEIVIKGNQKLVYIFIKKSFPFGIVVYLPETKIDDKLTTDVVGRKQYK
jgi:hypothetical protein